MTEQTTKAKVALVIGAGDSTGGAIARRFAKEGFTACLTRRSADKLQPLIDQIRGEGGPLADTDGLAGIQQLAGDATLLYYMGEEAQEGRNAYLEKRKPDYSRFPRRA